MHDNVPFHHAAPYATPAFDPVAARKFQASYLPQSDNQKRRNAGGIGGALVGIGLLFTKFKFLLWGLLGLKWIVFFKAFAISGFTFIASIWFYSLIWGWKFALVFVLLILVHELGHTLFMQFFGVPSSLPYFIPGFGAFVKPRDGAKPSTPLQSSYIALGGPLVGGLGAAALYVYGASVGQPFWIACAYSGFLLNAINLLPVLPLDGGRVVQAISPRIWIFGLVLLLAGTFVFHVFNGLAIILAIVAIPTAVSAWQTRNFAIFTPLSAMQRLGIGVAYFALIGFLGAGALVAHIQPVQHL